MRAWLPLLALGLVLAGCTNPDASTDLNDTSPVDPTPTPPTPQAAGSCARFDVDVSPASAAAGTPRDLAAQLTNCGNETLQLAHACVRGMDLRILVFYNSTTPDDPLPPGVGPKASYLVDNPIANMPLLCATAPPHVRNVEAGATLTYAVPWSGLYAPEGCADASCAKPLERGRYMVAATAVDARTQEAIIATASLVLA